MGSGRAVRAACATATTIVTSLLLAPPAWPADPDVACTITDPRIPEASGLAAAHGHLYVANDGGTSVVVFDLDTSCRVRRVRTSPVDPYDVEDLALTPDGRLWFADTGDNRRARATVALEVLAPGGTVALYRMRYPDGAHDAEALLVDRSGRPYVVTKDLFGMSGVYTPAAALSAGGTAPLRRVTTLRFGLTGTSGGPVGAESELLVTGGAVSADQRRVVLRTYTDLYVWNVPDGDIGRALRDGRSERIALPPERQGEAVTFTPDGRAVLTTSEDLPAPVHRVALPAPPPPPPPTSPAAATPRTHRDGPGPAAAGRRRDAGGSGGLRSAVEVAAVVIATVIVVGVAVLAVRSLALRRR